MPRSFGRLIPVGAAAVLQATAMTVVMARGTPAQQPSDLSISPFVTLVPTAGASPFAGLALTLIGSGNVAVRASAHLALKNDDMATLNMPGAFRPWGADADALLFFRRAEGYNRGLAPFVFAGVGRGMSDSAGYDLTRNDWSYGLGASLPLGSAVDLFGESRWRMSRFVLPTAVGAPAACAEFRFGVTFHVATDDGTSSRRRRR